MTFLSMPKIESPDFYIDLAFRNATKRVEAERGKTTRKDRLTLLKGWEMLRLKSVRNTLYTSFDRIMKAFPSLSQLPPFYLELIKITIEYDKLKKSLGAMKWARDKVDFFYRQYSSKLVRTYDERIIQRHRNEFYGRVSSVVKQVRDALEFLDSARRIIRDFPSIKPGLKTVAIAGFPNVGKTTLLKKLTESSPEISSYPFTTKSLNIGYAVIKGKKIQFIDTPGTLNRIDKMNDIEKQAYLALKLLADEIIYIFDLTEPYPLESQELLLEKTRALNKKIIVYLSKTDILEGERLKKFSSKYRICTSVEKLRDKLA